MLKIEFDGCFQKDLLIDITYQDSNEEPESACVHRVVSFKLGDKVFNISNKI